MFLALAICLSLAAPAWAADNFTLENEHSTMDTVEIIDISDSLRIEMRVSTQMHEKSATDIQCVQGIGNEIGKVFELRQIENGDLVQIVFGTVGGDTLTVTNFENGNIISVETIKVTDRIVKTDSGKNETSDGVQPTPEAMTLAIGPAYDYFDGNGSFPFAYITYNTSDTISETRKIDVYGVFVRKDEESYTINGVATDTLSVIAGLLTSVASIFFNVPSLAGKVAAAIVSGLGGSVAGGIIGVTFSEDVAVQALYYKMYGRFNGTFSPEHNGIAKQVVTTSSSHYNEWFYDGYTPYNWKYMDELAYLLWGDFFYEAWYPGVKNYS